MADEDEPISTSPTQNSTRHHERRRHRRRRRRTSGEIVDDEPLAGGSMDVHVRVNNIEGFWHGMCSVRAGI